MAKTTSKKSTKVAKKDAVKRGAAKATKPMTAQTKHVTAQKGGKVVLLSGGNPQIAKADGDAPVQAYIAAMPGWKRDIGERLDALVVRTVPDVRKAVRWNSPFYGIDGRGWFLGVHCFAKFVKVSFFRGISLRPVPPGGTPKSKDSRWIDIYEGDWEQGGKLDDELLASWIRQASELPGETCF